MEGRDGAGNQAAGAPIVDATGSGAAGVTGGGRGGVRELSIAASHAPCVPRATDGERPVGAEAAQGSLERGSAVDAASTRDEDQVAVAPAGARSRLQVKAAAHRGARGVTDMSEGECEGLVAEVTAAQCGHKEDPSGGFRSRASCWGEARGSPPWSTKSTSGRGRSDRRSL